MVRIKPHTNSETAAHSDIWTSGPAVRSSNQDDDKDNGDGDDNGGIDGDNDSAGGAMDSRHGDDALHAAFDDSDDDWRTQVASHADALIDSKQVLLNPCFPPDRFPLVAPNLVFMSSPTPSVFTLNTYVCVCVSVYLCLCVCALCLAAIAVVCRCI